MAQLDRTASRRTTADDCGAEVRARDAAGTRAGATTVRAAAQKAQAAVQRGAGPQRSHPGTSTAAAISTRSWPRTRKPRSRSCSWRCGYRRRCAACRRRSLPIAPFRGDLDWPVRGEVRRRFTPGVSKGIEIAAPEGTEAVAVHDGLVAFAGTFSGFGNLVILDHGSQTFSLYGDLLDISVKKGTRVDRGQTLGSVGPTAAGAPGLYFELRIDGQPVDPLQWLKRQLIAESRQLIAAVHKRCLCLQELASSS